MRKLMDLEVEQTKSKTGGRTGSRSQWRDYIWTHHGSVLNVLDNKILVPNSR